MNEFTLYFSNGTNNFPINFQCYNTPIALKWFSVLAEQSFRDPKIREPDRLYNFPIFESEEKIVDDINKCISIINKHSLIIPYNAHISMDQNYLNLLHSYFEKLRGSISNPTLFWKTCSSDEKFFLERFNILIHKLENFYRNKIHKSNNPRVVCTFTNRKRYLLSDDDYQYFTLIRNFGEVYINYCEVGKPLYDVFKDNDSLVGHNNIKPLTWYSPDFTVSFFNRSQSNVDIFLSNMEIWWEENKNLLLSLGFKKNSLKNSIGNIPVAKIKNEDNVDNLIENICLHYSLNFIKIV